MTGHPRQHVQALTNQLPHRDRIPRREGDMAFEQPWELRALSLAVALHDRGELAWDTFQHELIASVGQWEADPEAGDWRYYERWLVALEEVLAAQGLLQVDELDRRTAEVLATPPNREHQHAHPDPLAVCGPDHDHEH